MVGVAEISLQNPRIFLALPLLALLVVAFAWHRRFRPLGPLALRLTLIILVIAALSEPLWLPMPATTALDAEELGRLVILVDQSASLEPARAELRAEAARIAASVNDSVILWFASEAVIPMGNETIESVPINPEITDVANALSLGSELLKGRTGRLIMLSDGLATVGDTEAEVAHLVDQGIAVDVVIPGEAARPPEVTVLGLEVPRRLREGEVFDVAVNVHSTQAAGVTLTLRLDGKVLEQDQVVLEPGLNRFAIENHAEEIGIHTLDATVAATDGVDVQRANNSSAAYTQVDAPPQMLIVGEDLLQTARFTRELQDLGYEAKVILPSGLSDRLSDLEEYAGMVLVDVPASALALEQMIAVQEFVRTLGRGLLVTGGRNSYSLGQYEDTPLEEALPVSLEPPPREERPPVALLLIIDHSGSMVARSGVSKLGMAKEAAIRATDILGPEDMIGVLIFDTNYEWIVPFQHVEDGAAFLDLQNKIATIPGGGGTAILPALEAGLPALAAQNAAAGARHTVLLTDGKSYATERAEDRYEDVVDAAREANITLSTIAIGSDADQELLTRLAERGLGRYHYAAVPEDIPDLTIAESAILSSNALQEGVFLPSVSMPHPLLRGLPAAGGGADGALPELRGYVGLTVKPWAEMVLQVGPGDPLLSVWGYGLGRVAAWSSDTGKEWAPAWLSASDTSRFWGQLVGYLLPTPDLGLLQLGADVAPDGVVTLSADGMTATGQTVDLARTRATLTTPSGLATQLNLVQTAPGRYQQRVQIREPGAYKMTATQARDDGSEEVATVGFVVPYSAEYGLPAPREGEALLRGVAEKTGGRVLSVGELLLRNDARSTAEDTLAKPVELWPWLLLAALVLWPVEIAWRRWGRLRIR
jgi:Ca-activated chloride channel family protein